MLKAMIAVRANSERVKKKNIRPFAGSSLLELKIEQLSRLSCLDGIVVNSDSPEMLSIAKAQGCETVLRNPVFSAPETPMSDVYVHMAEHFTADIVAYCNVTNPLIEDATIEKAISWYLDRDAALVQSVNTAHVIKEFLYWEGKPLNYDPLCQPRSQDLPEIYALNFAVNIISRADMLRFKNIIAPRHRLLPVSEQEAVDIDSEQDFSFAEFLYQTKKGRVYTEH